jgi:ABC-type tungstate transport system permease subunit
VAAPKAIALARAPFVSRSDRSDNNIEELRLWRIVAISNFRPEPYSSVGSTNNGRQRKARREKSP